LINTISSLKLEIEKNKAIDSQDFEKCAYIRELIEDKTKKKD